MRMLTDEELTEGWDGDTPVWMAASILLNRDMADFAKLIKNPQEKIGIEVSKDFGLLLLRNNNFDPLSNKDEFRLRIGTFTGGYRIFLNLSFPGISYNVVLL